MKHSDGWAILGRDGRFYIGWWFTRVEAIANHTHDLYETVRWVQNGKLNPGQKEAWQKCKANGDRAVKIRITQR